MKFNLSVVAAGLALLVTASATQAATITTSTRDTLEIGAFFPGDGNDANNFAITRVDIESDGTTDIEIAVKAKQRFVEAGNVYGSGIDYFVQGGFSPVAGGSTTLSDLAWWNFDFSVDFNGLDPADYGVFFRIDGPAGERFLASGPASGSLVQASQNIGFSYIENGGLPGTFGSLGDYNPSPWDSYIVTVGVTDNFGLVAAQAINVIVTPTPSAALGGLGLISLIAVRRLRR